MRSAIVRFPGTNREHDMAHALTLATGRSPALVWHADTDLPPVDLVVLPGGFSYGDYLRSGAIAARAPIMDAVKAHADRGALVMGVCNGFQMLTEAGLLPGALMRNAGLNFVCKVQHLRIETVDSPFTRGLTASEILRFPIAHHDGNYFADDAILDALEAEDRVALRYCDASGADSPQANPNGSARSIAGILNRQRNVLGLMPHPENLVEPELGGTDGLTFLRSLMALEDA